MAETIGDLIDKLSIVNNKLWHVQEKVYGFSRMTEAEYSALPPQQSHEAWKKIAGLNLARTALIVQIDTELGKAIRTGKAPEDAKVKITD